MDRLRILPIYGLIAIALMGVFAPWGLATSINFDDQALTGLGVFDSTPPQTLNIPITGFGNVKFEGGVILTATSFLANKSSVYGTADFGGGTKNPLVITFAFNITDFSLVVYNGEPLAVDFKVYDNLGNTVPFTLPSNLLGGSSTITLPVVGNVVSIEAINPSSSFDFLIDNISFTEASPAVPEPTSLLLLGTGLLAIGFSVRRRKK